MRIANRSPMWRTLILGLLWLQAVHAMGLAGWAVTPAFAADAPPSLFLPMLSRLDSATPASPAIRSFIATPNTVNPGGKSTLAWDVVGAATLSISPGIGTVTGTQIDVNPTATTEFTLTAANAAGSVTAKATVTVTDDGVQDGATWLPFSSTQDGVVHTRGTNLVVDGSGGIHAGYAIWTGLDNGARPAYYAFCASGCNVEESWTRTSLEIAGDWVADVRVALDPAGRPRMLLFSSPIGDSTGISHYTYATCNSQCLTPASWALTPVTEAVLIDTSRWDYAFRYFALDPQGHPAFIYTDGAQGINHNGTFYATCLANPADKCNNLANWAETKLDPHWLSTPSLAFSSSGQPRIAFFYYDANADPIAMKVLFSACDADCLNPDNWSGAFLTDMHGSSRLSLRVDSQGRPRLAFYAGDFPTAPFQANRLYYLWCDNDCTNSAQNGWQMHNIGLGLRHGSDVDLALDSANRPRLAYDAFGSGLGYAWCDTNCQSDTAPWQHQLLENSAALEQDYPVAPTRRCTISTWVTGEEPSLALDKHGNPRFGYVAEHGYGGDDLDHPGEACPTSTDILLARFMQFGQP